MCVCASVGAWAEGDSDGYYLSFDTWFQNVSSKTEFAAKIHLTKGGVLGNAIAELQTGEKKGSWWPQGSSSASEFSYSDCKILYINGESITDDDLTALANLDIETIVLQDVTWTASSKMFTNQNVKNLILPDNWTKEEVNAIGAAIGAVSGNQLGSCFSRGVYTHTGDVTTYSYTDSEGTHDYTGQVTDNNGELTGTIDVHHTLTLYEDGTNPYYYYQYNNVKTYLSGDEEGLNTDKTQYTFYPSQEVKLNGPETKMYKQDGVTEIHSYDGDVGVHSDDGKWYYDGTNKQWTTPPTVEGGTEAIVKEFYTYQDPYNYQTYTIEASDTRIHDGADGKYITITKSTQETTTVYKEYKYYYIYPEGAEDIEANRTYVTKQNETTTEDYVEHKTVTLESETHSETTDLGSSIVAYVNRGNTLRDATLHAFLDNKANTALGNWNKDAQRMNNVVAASISGNAVALDIAGGDVVAQSDGHFKYDKEADEMGDAYNAAVGGGTRSLQGTEQPGALYGASLQKLDLEDAIIEDEYCEDITISALNIINDKKSQVIIPTYSGLKTLPADFMNMSTSIRSICIPSNIEVIRTRAFKTIDYIWTTSGVKDPEGQNTRLDNGTQYSKDGEVVYATTDEDFDYNEVPFGGSYTFSSNLKVIERAAFANSTPHVKDVYVLNTVAPECHVDAFNTQMYTGNNGYTAIGDDEKIISRSNYYNGSWITVLHYPRQTTDPEIQRYTDPTREYSIATGERDGKGAVLYYPNQTEFNRAYNQGTYGYTWNAWDATRRDNNSIESGTMQTTDAWKTTNQAAANNLYNNNSLETDEKKFYTFYDVTLGNNTKPEGLADYYKINWNTSTYTYSEVETGGNLYPKAETTEDLDNDGMVTTKDYRGWHQFVLNAYAANTILEEEPYRSYITDNEWWTICPEFDITRAESAILFGKAYGLTTTGPTEYPYVHKLAWVRRNYADKKIYLGFSKNLTEYKEVRTNGSKHGTRDEHDVLITNSVEQWNNDDIVMKAGVPYLIKPTFAPGASRQFRFFKTEADLNKYLEGKPEGNVWAIHHETLYNKIQNAMAVSGEDQMKDVYDGIYIVPAFVSESNGDGSLEKEPVLDDLHDRGDIKYSTSAEWCYAFVGTFYKSFLPLHGYFLGWDSSLKSGKGGARFYYHDEANTEIDSEMRWVNGTGVIVPIKKSVLSGGKFPYTVTPKAGTTPAQWIINDKFEDDSYVATAGGSSRVMDVVLEVDESVDDNATGITEVQPSVQLRESKSQVYSINGQLKGSSLRGLSKGVYIVNGKKLVVK